MTPNSYGQYHTRPPVPAVTPETAERLERIRRASETISSRTIDSDNTAVPADFPDVWRNHLNPAQILAAATIEGPLLVIAGAGSGKTHTITHRVAWMLRRGIPAHEIVLLTFTKKAAWEMKRRISDMIPRTTDDFIAGTFHSFAHLMLRQYARLIGLNPAFSIIDTTDSADIIRILIKRLGLTSAGLPKRSTIVRSISRKRNEPSAQKKSSLPFENSPENIPEIETITDAYRTYKRKHHLMDFDDLLDVFRENLEYNEVFRKKIRRRFHYILVDEFQDTNIMQNDIITLMAEEHRNIMVVGDDSQSIYGFRGAHFENILLFPETWPDARLIKLEQNYRSTGPILDLTNAVVAAAKTGYKKELRTEEPRGTIPMIRTFPDTAEEASFITDTVHNARSRYGLKNIAVLYRASFHGNHLQAQLLKAGIPFTTYGGLKFNERMHVKDVVAWLRVIDNPADEISWSRILSPIPGIGPATVSKLLAVIAAAPDEPDLSSCSGRAYCSELTDTVDLVTELRSEKHEPAPLLKEICNHYIPRLSDRVSDAEDRISDLETLREIAEGYRTVKTFLSDFLIEPPDNRRDDGTAVLFDQRKQKEDTLTLSTIHSAKGLEWDMVIVPHLLDGFFPSMRAYRQFLDIEEERRLFYVACSRARKELLLTLPVTAFARGRRLTTASRFLGELPENTYQFMPSY